MNDQTRVSNSRSRLDFHTVISETASAQTGDVYVKVPGAVGLYRHAVSGRYYAVKKIKGKRRERSLDTTDRKIAERRLREWITSFEKVDAEVEKTTLGQLCASFIAVNRGKSESSQCIIEGVLREFNAWWPHGADFQVRNIRPSHLEEWLAMQEARLKNTTYNRYAGVLKQIFELAVKDRIIAESRSPAPVERSRIARSKRMLFWRRSS